MSAMIKLNRRMFLKLFALSSAAALALRYAWQGPKREPIPMGPNVYAGDEKALVSKINSGSNVKEDIKRAVDLIGGFKSSIGEGERVLLKPNFNTADPPPASSDPEFVRAIIELLYENGAGEVILGESSTAVLNTRDVLEETGMLDIAKEAGARVVVFDEKEWVNVATKGESMESVHLAGEVFNVDKIVYAVCLKTHSLAKFTGSLKLAVGMMKPTDRMVMHSWNLQGKIAELNTVVHPDLMIMDARTCFISGGPSRGKLREPGLIMASGDRIAMDVEALKVIKGYPGNSIDEGVWELKQIQRAVELGLGALSEDEYRVVEG
jgi:uncharacterized protein (DUF362 family)